MLEATDVILEGDRRQREALAARREVGHDPAALVLADDAPARDLVEGTGAAHADVALGIHDADLDAGALHFLFAAIARPALEAGSFFRIAQIHWPMPTSLSRSTPVSMPRPCSM